MPKRAALILKENPSDNRDVTKRYEGRTHERDRNDITPPTKKALAGEVAFSRILLLFSLNGLLVDIFTYPREESILYSPTAIPKATTKCLKNKNFPWRLIKAEAITLYPRKAPAVNENPTLRTLFSSTKAIIERRNTIIRKIDGLNAFKIPRAITESVVNPVNSVNSEIGSARAFLAIRANKNRVKTFFIVIT